MSEVAISYLGLLLAVVGIPVSFYISRYFANRKGMRWYFQERKVLDPVGGEFPSSVQLFFDGVEVKQLSEWSIGIWNSGNQSITANDVVKPLEITFKHCQLIKASDVSASREGIISAIDPFDEVSCRINFNFIDPGDGLTFTLYTEGEPSEGDTFDVSIGGTIIGVPGGPSLLSRIRKFDKEQFLSGILLSIFCFSIPIAFIYFGWIEIEAFKNKKETSFIATLFELIQSSDGREGLIPFIAGIIFALLYIPAGLIIMFNVTQGYFSSVPDNVCNLIKEKKYPRIANPARRFIIESLYRTTEFLRLK